MIARALLAAGRLDVEQCAEPLAFIARATLTDGFWPFVMHARAQFALGWGDREGLLDELNRTRAADPYFEEVRRQSGVVVALLAAAEANVLMALGRGNRAWTVLSHSAERHPHLEVVRARLALLCDDPSGALHIAGALNHPSVQTAMVTHAMMLDLELIKAVAFHRLGAHNEANAALRACLKLSSPDTLFAFAFVPRADLLELMVEVPSASLLLTEEVLARLPIVFPRRLSVLELTRQEQLVLNGLAAGKKARDLAAELYLSLGTVKAHQRHVYRKLGVNSRSEALAVATELGLLNPPD